jgi:integrase
MKEKLTNRFCKNVVHDGNKSVNSYFDTELTGFMLEVRNSGGKTFYYRYRQNNTLRLHKIGDAAAISVSTARTEAKRIKSEIAIGRDIHSEKNVSKKTPTLTQFYADHYLPHIKQRNRSWETHHSVFKSHILPLWGNIKMSDITRIMITKAHNDQITKGFKPATANKIPTFLRGLFNLAIKWEVTGVIKNPAAQFEMFAENNKVERYLSQEEAAKLMKAVNESANKMLKYIVSFLLLTGARRNECLQAKWCDFDFKAKSWTIPLSKSGKPHHIPITKALQALLESIPRETPSSAYVFPAPNGKSYTNIYTSWDHARNKAGLHDVRMHDLRHTFASTLVNNGRSLYEVQALLGHHNISVTARYAHLSNDSLAAAADCASILLPGLTNGSNINEPDVDESDGEKENTQESDNEH